MSAADDCRKVRYGTEREALRSLRSCKARGRGETHPYRCRLCGSWHLASGQRRRPRHR